MMHALVTLIALLRPLGLGVSAFPNTNTLHNRANLRSCDESFPLAPPPPPDRNENGHTRDTIPRRRKRHLIAIEPGSEESREFYETGEYYAPLCPDGNRIDIRKLKRCTGGACFDEYISQCTFECTWNGPTPQLTSRPTNKPTDPPIESEHPLLLSLKDLPETYRMDAKVRNAIILYLYNKLKNDLEELPIGLELLDLFYPGRLPGRPHDLPLAVKLKGPSDIAEFALEYLQQLVEDSEREIVENLKKLDGTSGEAFQFLRLIAGTFDFDDIIEESLESNIVQEASNPPSVSPTPVPKPVKVMNTIIMEETETGIPSWVWFIVTLAILLCCICGVFLSRYYCYKRDSDNKETETRVPPRHQFNRYMQHPQLRPSFTGNKGTERNQRPRRRVPDQQYSVRSKRTMRTNRNAHTKRSMAHTKRSRRTPLCGESRTSAPATSIVIPSREVGFGTNVSRVDEPRPSKALDGETVISALPGGFDPPEEHAIVLYDPDQKARDSTFHTDRMVMPNQVEPEGDVADQMLMSGIRSEREETHSRRKREARKVREDDQAYHNRDRGLSDPEGLLPDDRTSKIKKKKSKKKRRKRRESSKANISQMSDRLRSSFTWTANTRELPMYGGDANNSVSGGPSILTTPPNPPKMEQLERQEQTSSTRNEEGHCGSRYGASKKKRGLSKTGLFTSITRMSGKFERGGIGSIDESYNAQSHY